MSRLPAGAPDRLRRAATHPVLLAVALAVLVAASILLATGQNPVRVFVALLQGGLDGPGLRNSIKRGIPITGMGLAVGAALRAGILNLGVEGQLVLGGFSAAMVVLLMPPGPVGMVVAILAGAAVGGLWALLSAVGQVVWQVPILITSLLLNYVARSITSYMVRFHVGDPGVETAAARAVPDASALPTIVPDDVSVILDGVDLSLLVVLALVVWLAVYNERTVGGYETRIIGLNALFGKASGVAMDGRVLQTMLTSGAIAGLFGGMLVLGDMGRYYEGELVNTNYAWIGLMVALVAAFKPWGILVAGFLFAVLQVGGLAIQRQVGVESRFSLVIQSLIIVALTAIAAQRAAARGRPRPEE